MYPSPETVVAPQRLRPGATVAIPAPASPVDAERLETGMAILRERYTLRVADDVLRGDGYLAGDDARRADELNGYLRDPDVRAIFVGRGGYGLMRILADLDADALRADPIPIVGFSDVTVLLAWAWLAAGVRGVHGPVVTQLGDLPAEDIARLFEVVEDPDARGSLQGSAIRGTEPVEGPLLGGNLTLVSHLIGTPYEIDFRGAVALFEDVDEKPYAVDRYFTRMAMARAFSGCRGVAIGDFTRCEGRADVREVIRERLEAIDLPGVGGLPIGHADRNWAVPFGGRCALDPARQTLEILDAAVV